MGGLCLLVLLGPEGTVHSPTMVRGRGAALRLRHNLPPCKFSMPNPSSILVGTSTAAEEGRGMLHPLPGDSELRCILGNTGGADFIVSFGVFRIALAYNTSELPRAAS